MENEADRSPFDKIYFTCLAKTVFFLNIGAASAVGQFYLSRLLVDNELFNIIVASVWAMVMIAVYAYIDARDKEQYARVKTELYNIKLVRSERPIAPVAPEKPAKSKVSKIEIQHTMDPSIPQDKLPVFLRKEKETDK